MVDRRNSGKILHFFFPEFKVHVGNGVACFCGVCDFVYGFGIASEVIIDEMNMQEWFTDR